MNTKTLLTIIIPHYNSVETLHKILDSIPNDSEIQTIVIDDNSTEQIDDLEKIIAEKGEYIEYYTSNKGARSAGTCRNIGLKHAKGEWLLFADADDFFMDDFYKIVSDFFNTEYDIIFFEPTSIYLGTKIVADRHIEIAERIKSFLDNPTREREIRLRTCAVPWSKLIRHELVKKHNILFDEVLYDNDSMFSAKVGYYARQITASTQIIYCVTQRKQSLTTCKDVYSFDIRMNELIKVKQFLMSHYDKSEWDYLGYWGIGFLLTAIERNYGIKKCVSILLTLKKNEIPLLKKHYNIIRVIKVLRYRKKNMKKKNLAEM